MVKGLLCVECDMTFPPDSDGIEMFGRHAVLKHGVEEFIVKEEDGRTVFSWRVEDEEWTEFTTYDEKGNPVSTYANVVGENE
jgi:hypothetical protein